MLSHKGNTESQFNLKKKTGHYTRPTTGGVVKEAVEHPRSYGGVAAQTEIGHVVGMAQLGRYYFLWASFDVGCVRHVISPRRRWFNS